VTALLDAVGLHKTFRNGVKAVDGVDLHVDVGETLGLVGESGCGKSTTAKLVLRLMEADEGEIRFESHDLRAARGRELRRLRARLQVVPQHPNTSLNPRRTVADSIVFNLKAQQWPRADQDRRVHEVLDRVGLNPAQGCRYPHELSGGQLQRVAIARALATNPVLVVCDEAVSALDKSIQSQVLNLLAELQADLGVAYLFISHDLAVVEHIADQVAVMYLGRVVEQGTASEVLEHPLHPYTQALLSAAPGTHRQRVVLQGELPSAAHPPSGCSFRTRCPYATDACSEGRPPLVAQGADHWVACVLHPQRRPAGTLALSPSTTAI
jgi:oligopeptide/dipeptide ABC transporter ATP-binding protein